MLLGHQALATTTRYLRLTRPYLATLRSPCDLLPGGALPQPTPEYPHGAARHRLSPRDRGGPAQGPTVGSRPYLRPLGGALPPGPSRATRASEGEARP
jgi:hypothetical protein